MVDRFRELDRDHFDAVVVGAGTGGLMCAALLARAGVEVLLIDQHYVPGGNATIFRRPGYEFDVGVHYLGGCHEEGNIPTMLRAADARGVEFEELDQDGYDVFHFPDFQFRMPAGFDTFEQRLLEHFPDERRGIRRYVKLLRQLARLADASNSKLKTVLAAPRSTLLLRHLTDTQDEFLDTCTHDPGLRAVLSAQGGDHGLPPSRVSLLVAAGITQHYLRGAWMPKGGSQAMSDALADSIERHGGRVLLRARATRILVEDGRACGVELENPHLGTRRIKAPIVVSNADLRRTLLELVGSDHLSEETIRRTRDYEMSPALSVLFLGVRGDLSHDGVGRANHWIYPELSSEACYSAAREGRFLGQPFVFASPASRKDPTNPRLAPEGVDNLQLITVTPSEPAAWGVTAAQFADGSYREDPRYQEKKDEVTRGLLSSAERWIPGISERVVFSELASPLTHTRYTGSTGGTSYGIAHTPEQVQRGRPGARTEVEGLFLCGANTRSGHGIEGAASSGRVCAEKILRSA